MTQGEAIASGGQASRQMDVLIYDAFHAPVLLASDSSAILAAESVYAGIEVKPALTASMLEQAVENLASLKQAWSAPHRSDERGNRCGGSRV